VPQWLDVSPKIDTMAPYYIVALLAVLIGLIVWRKRNTDDVQDDYDFDNHVLVELKIPGGISPIERCDKYEDPLSDRLIKLGIGFCDGGGTELGSKGEMTCSVIDVYLKDIDQLDVVRNICVEMDFPSNIEFVPMIEDGLTNR
jgi:hypothetical protein